MVNPWAPTDEDRETRDCRYCLKPLSYTTRFQDRVLFHSEELHTRCRRDMHWIIKRFALRQETDVNITIFEQELL